MKVLAGAAALAGVGYVIARRSGERTARGALRGSRDVRAARGSVSSARSGEVRQGELRPESHGEPRRESTERVSSAPDAPDALDVALSLEGVFDGTSESGTAVTARPHDHVPTPLAGDDEDAPSADDLGLAWLTQATESERSLGSADTLPDVENLQLTIEELGEGTDANGDGIDDDETTAEYVRRHRISSVDWSADLVRGPKG